MGLFGVVWGRFHLFWNIFCCTCYGLVSQRSSTIVKVDSDGFGHYLSHLASGVFRKTRQIGAEDGWLGGGNSNIFYFHPYLGKIPILTNIFQMG